MFPLTHQSALLALICLLSVQRIDAAALLHMSSETPTCINVVLDGYHKPPGVEERVNSLCSDMDEQGLGEGVLMLKERDLAFDGFVWIQACFYADKTTEGIPTAQYRCEVNAALDINQNYGHLYFDAQTGLKDEAGNTIQRIEWATYQLPGLHRTLARNPYFQYSQRRDRTKQDVNLCGYENNKHYDMSMEYNEMVVARLAKWISNC